MTASSIGGVSKVYVSPWVSSAPSDHANGMIDCQEPVPPAWRPMPHFAPALVCMALAIDLRPSQSVGALSKPAFLARSLR